MDNKLSLLYRKDGTQKILSSLIAILLGMVFGSILIVIVGHTLNLAMCVLGAFVHPLRLNFLEFFKNSGYEGTGRRYNPLTENVNN